MHWWPLRYGRIFLTGCLVLGLSSEYLRAQAPQFPFDPNEFFEKMFGKETEADRRALAKIAVSQAEERELGNRAADAYLKELRRQRSKTITTGRDADYVRRLVEQVRPLMKNARRYRRIKVVLVDTERTDARSFPGGTLVFDRGLIDYAESEAALVAVIGHELSHLDRGHQLNNLRRMKLAQSQTANGLQDPRRMMNVGMTWARMFAKPFRPEDERQADRDGVRWAHQLGYEPLELARLFGKFERRNPGNPANQFVPGFFRTHPVHADRRRDVLELRDELQRGKPAAELYAGRENLQRRITRRQREWK